MNRKQQEAQLEEFLDPIARAAKIKERTEFLQSLFYPIAQKTERRKMEWLIPGLLPFGYLAILAGDPKCGKTCLATALALAVATGTPFAGFPTKQTGVLWVAAEEGPDERNLLLDESPLADPATPLYTCYQPLTIDEEDSIDAIAHCSSETESRLVVIDPLHGASTGRSLNDGAAARKTLKLLKRLCVEKRITALVLHHAKLPKRGSRKNRVAENAQLSATASLTWVMSFRPLPSLVCDEDPALPSPVCDEGVNRGGAGGGVIGSSGAFSVDRAGGGGSDSQQPADHLPTTCRRPESHPSSQPADHLPTTCRRLLTLSAEGRGQFANKTIHLISQSPLEYMAIDQPPEPEEEQEFRAIWIKGKVLEVIETGPKTSEEIIDALGLNHGSVRNAITSLRREGKITVETGPDSTRIYRAKKTRIRKNRFKNQKILM